MFIREALISDLEGITDCAKRFFKYADYEGQGLPLDDNSFKEMVKGYIESENGIVLLMIDGLYIAGGIAGIVKEWGFNKSIKMCLELFYWVDEEYRGRKSLQLFKEYEKKAKEIGTARSVMISVDTYLKIKVNKFYKYMGYRGLEQYHIKSL